jgi:peptide/nickel transport system ATP-binding protein
MAQPLSGAPARSPQENPGAQTLLEIRNATKIYGGSFMNRRVTVALQDYNLTIQERPATITTIAGESGSGKSTLANLVLGFTKITTGQIFYKGVDIMTMNSQQQLDYRREVQAIFQDPYSVYNPFYRVKHIFDLVINNFKLARNKNEARDMIESALNVVGLRGQEVLEKYPHQLSGGQRQRIMVARALLTKPRLIIADEPVSMVDASLRATILESLRRLNRDMGISILYITHDLTTAYHVSKDILVLYKGSIAESGDVDHVIKDPKHPYTQLLVNSIPWPDLNRQWGAAEIKVATTANKLAASTGCKFADRCPHAMPICGERPPTLGPIREGQVAACFLYQ